MRSYSLGTDTSLRMSDNVALSEPSVVNDLTRTIERKGTVLFREYPYSKGRHNRLWRDTQGYFVRIGRRGMLKRYLTAADVMIDNGKPYLFRYRTYDR